MNKQLYLTDITDEQWNLIKDYFPPANDVGRPREIETRAIYNAIIYLLARACQADCVTAFFTYKEQVAPQIRWRIDSSPVSNFKSASSIS